jgi:hypothetical protein
MNTNGREFEEDAFRVHSRLFVVSSQAESVGLTTNGH